MPYAILDNSVRSNLEQERDRLKKDRASIIEAAVSSATSEIDKTLQHINELLGGAVSSNGSAAAVEAAAPAKKPRGKGKAPAAAPAPAPAPAAKAATKAPAAKAAKSPAAKATKSPAAKAKKEDKPKRNVKPSVPFDATLKRDFKGMTQAEAVLKVLSDSPKETFTTDEMIQVLYGSLESEKMPEARKRVALTMAHGMRKGTYEKVGDNPSRFKISG
ncbi:MAG: hypothetical protein MUC48_00685 [Leptolyngbya sp. Prado105]|nr:hypothetical protein [Leptolyngbya sp. Prado105]